MFENVKKIIALEKEVHNKDITIDELTAKLAEKESLITDLRAKLTVNTNELRLIKDSLSSTPDDCKMGKHCKACAFGKEYRVRMHDPFHNHYWDETLTICGKAGTCKNFVNEEEK